VCELIAAFPKAHWVAGKITQYGHGVCARNGENCDCAPTEHAVALDWESAGTPLTHAGSDSSRFLAAGAERAFWLRTKQGHLAEGMPLLREALARLRNGRDDFTERGGGAKPLLESETGDAPKALNVIIESNSLMQFVRPSLFVTVLDRAKGDFKDSARQMLDRADVFLFRRGVDEVEVGRAPWLQLPAKLLRERPSLLQREGEPLPEQLFHLVERILETEPSVSL